MKALLKPMMAAGLLLAAASPLALAPASAQVVNGIATVDLSTVVAGSNALNSANQQRPTHYKAQYDSARARQTQAETQLKPLVDKLRADSQAANPNQESLRQQQATIQQISQVAQNEINQILQPVILSEEYVTEQVESALPQAIENAAKKKKVGLVFSRDAGSILYREAGYNMTQEVINELNALLPTAQLVPPANWLPRQLREEQARRQAAQGQAAPAAAPAATTPAPAGPPAESR